MKKKNFKLLKLNKKSVSVLQFTGHIVGGTANGDCTHGTCPSKIIRRCPIVLPNPNPTTTGTTLACSELIC